MSNPENFDEEITPEERAEVDAALPELEAEMAGTPAARLAEQLVPVVPDGGRIGRALTRHAENAEGTVTSHLEKADRARKTVWLLGPALAATAAVLITILLYPVPGSLALYGLALAGFAWWHIAGRPSPIESARLASIAIHDGGIRVKAWITRLSERRGAYEARRTATEGQ